eukprot:Selendium_serpulae@DN6336_c0_g1_i1.p2
MSSFGTLFKVSTFGESHGGAVGVVVDGVPPDLEINEQDVQIQLTRRRPGQSSLTTQRQEEDRVEILSGTEKGKTLGTPIGMIVRNKDQRTIDYANTAAAPRPGHADYTYRIKYGIAASSGGGRASARETIGRVAAGAIGEKWLNAKFGTKIISWVSSVTHLSVPQDITAHNDKYVDSKKKDDSTVLLTSDTNHAGGTLGGITSGFPLVFRTAIKPVSSISLQQETLTYDGDSHTLAVKGRHDPCVLPRAIPLCEAMTAIVLTDLALRQQSRGRPMHTVD